MDLDTLLHHYFGTHDLATADAATLDRARERIAIDFGVEREPGRKFALWVLMETLGFAPPPADAFVKFPALRDAAYDFQRASYRMERDAGDSE
jgi:hypothetical protein